MRTLTDDQKDKFIAHVSKHVNGCARCGQRDMEAGAVVEMHSADQVGGKRIICATLICTGCGYIDFYHAGICGLLE